MTRHSLVVVVLLGLAACGSNPVQDNYYSLVLAADDVTAPVDTGESNPHLVVGPVQLPEYLQRRGIAMQIGANQIQTANHHLWAEPLEEAIAKVLVRDIADLASGVTVNRDAGRWSDSGDCRLRIEFDSFHATDRARVVGSGRYWLSSADREVRQEFDLTETLYGDGYAQAVAALRQ
jgi:uncharacterized lipoprotein YmbA